MSTGQQSQAFLQIAAENHPPTLDHLVRDPSCALRLGREALTALLAQCSTAQAFLLAALASLAPSTTGQQTAGDQLLTIEEAARKLSVSREWLYRHGKRLRLAIKLGDGTLRFSSIAIDDFIRKQRSRLLQ